MVFKIEVIDPTALEIFEECGKPLERFGEVELESKSGLRSSRSSPDGYLTIAAPNGTKSRYVCEVKPRIDLSAFAPVAARLHQWASDLAMKPLLLTRHVSDALGDRLRDAKIAYFDATGNAWLTTDPLVYIWLRGFKPLKQPERVSRAFQTSGLQLIAFLLSRPEAVNQPYRKIAEQAGLSLGSTSRIISDLRSLGFIQLVGSDRNSLVHVQSLLEHWELGYATRLRPRLKPQSFRPSEKHPLKELYDRTSASMRDEILVGGELAAAFVTGNLRPQTATFHIRPHRPLLPMIKEMRLIPDKDGNITFLEQFGEMSAWRWDDRERRHLVNPLLVYAELLHRMPDDRLRETANLILHDFLAPISDETAARKS